MLRPRAREVGDSTRLVALLKGLGVGSDVVEPLSSVTLPLSHAAAATIAEWMTYLPESCVKAMVATVALVDLVG